MTTMNRRQRRAFARKFKKLLKKHKLGNQVASYRPDGPDSPRIVGSPDIIEALRQQVEGPHSTPISGGGYHTTQAEGGDDEWIEFEADMPLEQVVNIITTHNPEVGEVTIEGNPCELKYTCAPEVWLRAIRKCVAHNLFDTNQQVEGGEE